MAAATYIPLPEKAQQSFIEYYRATESLQFINRGSFRNRLTLIDKAYQRELINTTENARAKAANNAGDPNRYQDITVPVVMPQIEAAVTHQTAVFLSEYPLFPVSAGPEYADAAMAMETVVTDQAVRGGWARELMMFFRDGFKYNFAPLEVCWDSQVSYGVENNPEDIGGEAKPVDKVIWSGNTIKRWDPYNTFVDTRVAPSELYSKGEFAGKVTIMSRIALKAFIASLDNKIIANINAAFSSGRESIATSDSSALGYFVPDINPEVDDLNNQMGGTNWMRWAGIQSSERGIEYKDSYEVTTLYARVLPSDFDLKIAKQNTPQVYKLYIVNHQVIIYAELLTNAHNYIPVLIGAPLEDGLNYQTKSMATNSKPFQDLSTAHLASITASKRRAISDRTLYDPSRIGRADINSDNPSAKIPVRPAAYGKSVGDAVYAFPYREDQLGNDMAQIKTIVAMGNELTGQNAVSQGQFIKGNKTNEQFNQVMSNASGRDQMASILLEYQVFVPLKEILKINILQYQGGTSLYNRDKNRVIEVDPIKLRKAVMEFKISDGLIPAESMINSEEVATAIQVIGSSAVIAQGYNIAPMFSYLMKTRGADLRPFEKSSAQLAYEQAVAQWQQIAMAAIEQGADPEKLPPMPTPEQFNYNPESNTPQPQSGEQEQQAASSPALPNL
jgi:hypothetical protein